MATKKITALTEYDAVPAIDDSLVMVDKSDTSQAATGTTKRINADRFVATDGTQVTTTGGGAIALGGFTLTVPETMTAANDADVVRYFIIPFNFPMHGSVSPWWVGSYSTSYTSLLGPSVSGGEERMQAYIYKARIPTNATVKLRVRVKVSGASTGSVQLVNSSSVAVSGSEVTTTSTSYEWVTSGDIKSALTAGEERYSVSAKNSAGGSVATDIAAAQFVIEVP